MPYYAIKGLNGKLHAIDRQLKRFFKTVTITNYWKKVAWSQPVNPSGITATSGWTNPANAFDNNESTYATCGTSTDYIEWKLGAEVLLRGITATGQWVSAAARSCNLIVKSVNANGTETTLGRTTGAGKTATYNLSVTFAEVQVNRLRFYLTNGDDNAAPTTTYKSRIREIKLTATQQVVAGTESDYSFTTSTTKEVEVSADDDYDRTTTEEKFCVFARPSKWKTVYKNFTLPTMTSRTAPIGWVDTNISNGEYTIDAYNFFFNRNWYFEAEGRTGSRYNRYTFQNPLKPDTYTISFRGDLQSADRNSGTLSVWYTDGSKQTLISYTLTTSSQTFSKTFTTTKMIKTISIDMTVSTSSHKNDVTTFGALNIVSTTGQLQTFMGYEKA